VLYDNLSRAKADYERLEEEHEQLEDAVIGIGYRLNSELAGIGYRPDNDFDTVDKALDGIDTSLKFVGELVDDMQEFTAAWNELKTENEMLKETIAKIQLEAEQARQSGFWDSLLQLIFSIMS
jgi:multidrug resistance efflux pump